MNSILVTSALPYINGVKHLGNLVGSMLPADVFARFQRARGRETLYICATDEHGTPAELAALEAGQDVATYCAEQHDIQKELGERFGLSWDYFGRSSRRPNHELTQHFARALWKRGHLEVRMTKQVYSNADKRFLPDRYVIGTCPHCGYERARGDQCENCTRVLDPADLINPRSALSGSTDIEIRDSAHLFLKQSQFVRRSCAPGSTAIASDWPVLVTSIANKWLDEGLHDRGITRDLEWGVPVPDDIGDGKLKGKVFYVWFDAPIEYIGATKEWADANGKGDAWRDWWYGDAAKDVTYYEFMGKDNVPFHTVGFPVTILGSGEPWKLVDRIKGFNYINYCGGKFSTSAEARRVHGFGAGDSAGGLLALLPDGECAGEFGLEFHLGAFRRRREQGSGRCAGQFRQPRDEILRGALRRQGAGRGRIGRGRGGAGRRARHAYRRVYGLSRGVRISQGAGRIARDLGCGQRISDARSAMDGDQDDRARAAVGVRMGLNLVHLFGHLAWPVIPRSRGKCTRRSCRAPRIIPWPDETDGANSSTSSRPAAVQRPTCCSPRSPTNKSPNGSSALRVRAGSKGSHTEPR